MALDRGNNVVYLFALTYFVYFYSTKFAFSSASYFIVVASLLKPQMLLLLIILVINNRTLILIKAILIYLVVNTSLFLFFSNEIWSNLLQWIDNLSGYQTYAGVPSLGNYSFANSIGLFRGFIGLLSSDIEIDRVFRPGLDSKSVSLLSGLYLLAIIFLMLYRRNSLDIRIQLFILTCIIVIVPGTSFGYYVLLLLVPLLFLETIKQHPANEGVQIDALYDYSNVFNRCSRVGINILYFLVIPLWPFQWGMLDLPVKQVWAHYGVVPTIAGSLLWFLPLVLATNSRSSSLRKLLKR